MMPGLVELEPKVAVLEPLTVIVGAVPFSVIEFAVPVATT
jgi:hypothetical protein